MNEDYKEAVSRRMWLEDRVVAWEQRVQTLLSEATEAKHEIELCKAELRGIELGLGARAVQEAECREPASEARGATAAEAEAEDATRRRRRGEVQAMVYDQLMLEPDGATALDLAATLGLRKAQVDRVLEHHLNGGRVKVSGEPGEYGLWYAIRPGAMATGHEAPHEAADEDDDRRLSDLTPEFELKDHPHV